MNQRNSGKISTLLNAAGYAALTGAAAHLLLHYQAYVARFHDMSLFVEDFSWFAGHFQRPGGILLYAGRFLTQFCLHPVAAVVLFLAVLARITFLMRRLLIKDSRYGFLAALPALGLFAFVSGMGYEVITARSDAQIFTQPLGFLASLLILGLLQKISSRKGAWAGVVAVTALAYPLFGAYGLLASLTFAFWCIFNTEGRSRCLLPAAALLTTAAAPVLWFRLAFNHTVPGYLYLEGLPYLDYSGYQAQFFKLGLSAASLLLCALPRFRSGRQLRVWQGATGLLIFAVSVCAVYILPERRSLFHREMEAERAIARGDWNKVLSITATHGVTNDVLVAYRDCALGVLGSLPQDCWKYSFKTVPINSGKTVYPSSRIAGPAIFFHSGLANFASRWASEISLYGSWSVERIQYLAKTALLNGEYDLAMKYIDTIGKTTLDKAWARRYMAYAQDPSLMEADPEMRRLKALQEYDEASWYPSDVASYDVLLFYSFVKGRSPEALEWNLAAALLTKSGQWFEEIYPDYAASHNPVPEEVEEAHRFFSTLIYDDQKASDPDNYVHFYYNATVLRPN